MSHIHCVVPRIPQSTDCTGARPVHVAIDDQLPIGHATAVRPVRPLTATGAHPGQVHTALTVPSPTRWPMGRGQTPSPHHATRHTGPPAPPRQPLNFKRVGAQRRASDGRPCVAQPAAGGTAARPAPPPPRPLTLHGRPPRIGPPRAATATATREAYRARSLPPPPSPEALGKGPHMTCMPQPTYHTVLNCTVP